MDAVDLVLKSGGVSNVVDQGLRIILKRLVQN